MACSLGRFLELIVTGFCLFFHTKSAEESDPLLTITSGTFLAYTVILGLLVIAECFLDKSMDKGLDAFFSFVSSLVFLAIGLLIIRDWHGGVNEAFKTERFTFAQYKSSLALVNAALFFLDSIFTCTCTD